MARLWISMAADGEIGEVERAALDEHLELCDDCAEWRALAEAVVLHVRTTPPSPVPAGLLPELPPQALAAPRAGGARRRRGRGRRGGRGARRRRGGLELVFADCHGAVGRRAGPSEIVVGWNTSDTLDGRPLSIVQPARAPGALTL